MIKHIIFDWDNTLSMTEYANFLAENEGAKRLGLKPQSRKFHKETAGMEFKEALAVRFPDADPQKLMDVISKDIYPEYIKKGIVDAISEKTLEVLKELKNRGYKLHILTSRREEVIKHLNQKSHQLSRYISHFFYLEKTRYKKPDPKVFNNLLKEIKARPSECLYIGDAPDDACALKAGLHFVATLESGLKKKEDFDGYNVDGFVSDLSELLSLIAGFGSKV